jgi:hypothetical protein
VKAGIFEKALAYVSTTLDAEQAKAEAAQQGYLDKIDAHSTHAKQSLSVYKTLGDK